MPFLAALLVALVAGSLAYLSARWYSRSAAVPARPAQEVARAIGSAVRPQRALRRIVVARLDRSAVTGLLLTLALAATLLGGVVLGVLALLVRRVPAIQHVDNVFADWSFRHRSSGSTRALHLVTNLGSIRFVLVFALVLVAVELVRKRSRWSVVFVFAVLAGEETITLAVKELVGRVRPALVTEAATLGPSFPSGHSATSSAFYAAAALVIGRTLPGHTRHLLIAAAVALAALVAASRVLLDLHFLSDVIGGLALGWAWFAVCAIAFGGRLLVPTAAAEIVAGEASSPEHPPARRAIHDR